jgi:hypothetical protein
MVWLRGGQSRSFLSSLPDDLIHSIIEQDIRNDQKRALSLCRCSRKFYDWCLPEIYRAVVLRTTDSSHLLLRTLEIKPNYISNTGSIVIRAAVAIEDLEKLLSLSQAQQGRLESLVIDHKFLLPEPRISPLQPHTLGKLPEEIICLNAFPPGHLDFSNVTTILIGSAGLFFHFL